MPESNQVLAPRNAARHGPDLDRDNILIKSHILHTSLILLYLTGQQYRPVSFLTERFGHQDRLNRGPSYVQTGNYSRDREFMFGIHCSLSEDRQASTTKSCQAVARLL